MQVRFCILLLKYLEIDVGEAFGFPSGPEGQFFLESPGGIFQVADARFGRRGIKHFEFDRITGKHRKAPSFQWWKRGGGDAGKRSSSRQSENEERQYNDAHRKRR